MYVFVLRAAVSIVSLVAGVSCAAPAIHNPDLDRFGEIYYVGGAGGGSVLTDWGRGVRNGFLSAGFSGGFTNFHWQTGLGVAVDQLTTVKYKRQRAAQLAEKISHDLDDHPDRTIEVIAMSAGTAIAVFALEALPQGDEVNTVVLLGSSLSSHYDIRDALARVRDRMYVITSAKDTMLTYLVPIAGTADREYCGRCSAGLAGFHIPVGGQRDPLYGKLVNIAWRPEFERSANFGDHLDVVNPRFIRDHVAPLLLGDQPRFVQPALAVRPPPEE